MKSTDHERWSDDLAAYLLGALEPGEVAELDRHLAVCERCRAELRRLEPAARALPEEVERIEPPAELRSRILGEVRADARGAGVDPGSRENGFPRRLAAWLRGSGAGPVGLRPIAGLAALALVVALAVYASGGGSGGEGAGARVAYHAGHAPGVTAAVVRTGKGGTLRLANVRQLPDDRILEAWVRREGRIEPVRALFVPDREGRASTTIADMDEVDTVMVTAEPRGGTDQPTSTPIVTVPIPQ
jgi:anti-sigma-K factor RskA